MRELVGDAAKRNRALLVAASLPAPYSHHLAVRVATRESRRDQLLMHEYLHQVTQANVDDPPAWLDEGLSEFWSTIEVNDRGARAGRELSHYARTLRSQRLIPLRELMQVRRGRYEAVSGRLGVFYAESWALVHYLITKRDARAIAYAPDVPADPAMLQKAFESYVRAGKFDAIVLPGAARATAAAAPPVMRMLTDAEALALRASVAVYGERPGVALDLAERALRLNPSETLALEVKGVYFFLTNRAGEARIWLKRATEMPSASFRAHYYYAVVSADTPAVAKRHLKRTLELKPGFKPALDRLAAFPELH
jgi:hypothetical protein